MILRPVILATAMVGCVSNNDNLQLGSGNVSIRGSMPGGYERTQHWPIASAWAQGYYSVPVGGNYSDAYGGIAITFSADTTSPTPPTCRDSGQFTDNPPHVSIQTTHRGRPSLTTGDVPFVAGVDLSLSTYASFDVVDLGTGHVTITAVDDERITGTFEGSGLDGDESDQVVGSFDVPICW